MHRASEIAHAHPEKLTTKKKKVITSVQASLAEALTHFDEQVPTAGKDSCS